MMCRYGFTTSPGKLSGLAADIVLPHGLGFSQYLNEALKYYYLKPPVRVP